MSYDDACQLLSEVSLFLEINRLFLTSRCAPYLLKDDLFTLDMAWSERRIPRYETRLPWGVPEGQYFKSQEALELLASTVRRRPETPDADILRVGLVRAIHSMYPGRWTVLFCWEHSRDSAFFDRQDLEAVIVVDESFSSRSGCNARLC